MYNQKIQIKTTDVQLAKFEEIYFMKRFRKQLIFTFLRKSHYFL